MKSRPSWWTPEKVLEFLRNGESMQGITRRVSAETQGAVSPSALKSDIDKWRESASWGPQFKDAIALTTTAGGVFKISKDWYPKFYDAMKDPEVKGNVTAACEVSEVGIELVYALRDKRNKCFDAEFDEACRILEGRRMADIRETLLNQAKLDGRIGQKVLEASMPHLHAPPQKIEMTGRIDHDHRHEHTHRLAQEVLQASVERTRILTKGRVRALPEQTESAPVALDEPDASDVIEGELVTSHRESLISQLGLFGGPFDHD